MPTISRLAHVALRTPDPESLIRHYRDAVGLFELEHCANGRRHLSVDGAGAALELVPAEDEGLDHVTWELAPGTDLAGVRAELEALDVTVATSELDDPGLGASLKIRDLDGIEIHLALADGDFAERPGERTGAAPERLGHVAIGVADTAAARTFYERVLGFQWSDSIADVMQFLRHGTEHHSLNVALSSNPGSLHHIAFELRDTAHLIASCDALAAREVRIAWGPGRHGAGHNAFTYHHAPDGHVIELFCDMDRMSHPSQGYYDPRPWHTDRPQRPRVWGPDEFAAFNAWGGPPPESMRG